MVERLNQLWWQSLPLGAARVSRLTGLLMSDGFYLVTFRRFAAVSPLIALLLGLVVGWLKLGSETVFSESLLVVIIVLAVGLISTLHGGLFVLGYAATNIFRTDFIYGNLGGLMNAQFYVALLLTYAAMAGLAIGVPFVANTLRGTIRLTFIPSADLRLIGQIIVGGALFGGVTFLYMQVLPLLIRPPFTWLQSTPTVEAAYYVQQFTWVIVVVAVVVGCLRVIAEAVSVAFDAITYNTFLQPVRGVLEKGGWLDNLPGMVKAALNAGIITLFLAGLLTNWGYTLLLFGSLFALAMGRSLTARLVPAWPLFMNRIPILLRLVISFAVVYGLASPYMTQVYGGSDFGHLLFAAIAGGLVFTVFFPPVDTKIAKEDEYEELL